MNVWLVYFLRISLDAEHMKTVDVDGYRPAYLNQKYQNDENRDCYPKPSEVLFGVGSSTLAQRLLTASKTVVDLAKLIHHRAVDKIVDFFFQVVGYAKNLLIKQTISQFYGQLLCGFLVVCFRLYLL